MFLQYVSRALVISQYICFIWNELYVSSSFVQAHWIHVFHEVNVMQFNTLVSYSPNDRLLLNMTIIIWWYIVDKNVYIYCSWIQMELLRILTIEGR